MHSAVYTRIPVSISVSPTFACSPCIPYSCSFRRFVRLIFLSFAHVFRYVIKPSGNLVRSDPCDQTRSATTITIDYRNEA